jgi:tripartite-type tricarboxylate transporter receptor subunit TctC
MATMPTLYRKLPFNVLNDFEYLGMVNDVPMTLIGKPQHAGQQLQGLRELDPCQNKGKINLAHAGLGSASHLCGLMFQSPCRPRKP